MAQVAINLPDIGEGITEGEFVNWLVKLGDKVSADQPLAEVMTDKATVEIPSPCVGIIKELKAVVGQVLPIGAPLLVIESESDVESKKPVSKKPVSEKPLKVPELGPSPSSSGIQPPVASHQVLAAPSTRRLARELKVDINQISATGPAGRVTRQDVLNGDPLHKVSPKLMEQEERVPLRGIRKKIAEKMQMAKQIIPHFTLMDEANVTEFVKLKDGVRGRAEQLGFKVTYLPFVIKALIAILHDYPMFNASIDDTTKEIVYKKYFNIGFAAETPNGLLVPVIKGADKKSILQLGREISDLAKVAREGNLKLGDMTGATITITNIGSIGGTYATPIINHPEVTILGMYRISDKPIVREGKLETQKTMNFTITSDHRLIDGAVAAHFLRAFIDRIEKPGLLMSDLV